MTRRLLTVIGTAVIVTAGAGPLAAGASAGPLAAGASAGPLAAGATGSTPAATVHIAGTGKVGRFGTAIVTVAQQCRADTVPAELVVNVVQHAGAPDAVTGTRAGTFNAVCDAATHQVQAEVFSDTGDEFVPGPVDVQVRFTVLDATSMDPLPQATDSAVVTLLAPGDVVIGQEARVARFGSVVVPLIYRCQTPWIVAEVTVEVVQGAVGGTAAIDSGLRCDARWHHIEVGVSSGSGDPFVRGFADIDVRMTLLDPIEFDPVWQAHDRQQTWVSPAARIVIDAAQRVGATVSVTVSARCQRPWVVAEWAVVVTQRAGRVSGSTFGQDEFRCDALWHRFTVDVAGGPKPFRPGTTTVSVSLDIQDPVDFDPVDQATDRRVLRLA